MVRILLLGLLGIACVLAGTAASDPGVTISACVVGSC